MVSIILLICAAVFACAAALVDAGHLDVGAWPQLLALAVACIALAGLPWFRDRA